MPEKLLSLLAPRKGHFCYESGHHGELWLDLAQLSLQPRRLRPFADLLAQRLAPHRADAVCGPLVGGALLAQMVAQELNLAFYIAEHRVRPSDTGQHVVEYRIPEAHRSCARGQRVAVVDDVINAGSAVRAVLADLQACGAQPVALSALLNLGSPASTLAANQGLSLDSLDYLPHTLWEPAACPLCAAGTPLANVAANDQGDEVIAESEFRL